MMVKTLYRTFGGIALLALCGCADPTPKPVVSATEAQKEPVAAPTAPIALTVPPTSTSPTRAASAKKRDDRKQTASVPGTAASPTPVQLVGMNEGDVQALFGAPSLVEDHAPGKTLRFRKHDCVLSVALYPDVQTRVFRTLSYEVTSDDHNAGAKQLCETKFGNVAVAD
jgi:hypothetical protein